MGDQLSDEEMIATMLGASGLLFLSGAAGPFFDDEGSARAVRIFVNCNDLFGPACADAEPLPMGEIANLYAHWVADKRYGASIWACTHRGALPWSRATDRMKANGAWTHEMDALAATLAATDAPKTKGKRK